MGKKRRARVRIVGSFDRIARVRKHGDLVKIELFSGFHNDRQVWFRGEAHLNNDDELRALFAAACSKGLSVPRDDVSWW